MQSIKPLSPYEQFHLDNPNVFPENLIAQLQTDGVMTRKQALKLLFDTKVSKVDRQIYNTKYRNNLKRYRQQIAEKFINQLSNQQSQQAVALEKQQQNTFLVNNLLKLITCFLSPNEIQDIKTQPNLMNMVKQKAERMTQLEEHALNEWVAEQQNNFHINEKVKL